VVGDARQHNIVALVITKTILNADRPLDRTRRDHPFALRSDGRHTQAAKVDSSSAPCWSVLGTAEWVLGSIGDARLPTCTSTARRSTPLTVVRTSPRDGDEVAIIQPSRVEACRDMISLARTDLDGIFAHAKEEYPNECCGLLIGRGNEVSRVWRAVNVNRSPTTYRVDPRELLRFFEELDVTGEDMVGIYHSHTRSPAYPSVTDVSYARGYPRAAYLIISLADRSAPVARSFRIGDGQITEEEVLIREASPELPRTRGGGFANIH